VYITSSKIEQSKTKPKPFSQQRAQNIQLTIE